MRQTTSATKTRLAVWVYSLHTGGMERVMVTLCNHLPPARYDITLFTCEGGGALEQQLAPPVKHHNLGALRRVVWLPRLALALKRLNPHAVLATGDTFADFARLRRFTGGRWRLALRPPIAPGFFPESRKREFVWGLGQADVVIFQGEEHRRAWLDWLGMDGRNTVAIPNPVDQEKVQRLAREAPDVALPPSPFWLCAGTLQRRKGQELLITAMGYLKNRGLEPPAVVLLGREFHAGYAAWLRGLAHERGVADKVFLPGETTNPFAVMARAQAVVLASRLEGFPNVLAEAQTLGVPALATRCPTGPGDIVIPGTGVLVEAENPHALAQGILDMQAALPGLDRRTILETGARFGQDRILPQYEAVLAGAAPGCY